MTCDPIALTELFFGELPADDAAALQRHAHSCAACTRALQELREDRERFSAPRSSPPAFDHLFDGIERRLAEGKVPPRRLVLPNPFRFLAWRRWAPSLLPAAVGGLALVLAFFVTGAPMHRTRGVHRVPADASSGLAMSVADAFEDITPAEAQLSACLISAPAMSNQSALACF